MLWVKLFHVIFMVTWFAGLFYLPRLLVYHVQANDRISLERFQVMERKLYIIMTIGMLGTLGFGFWLLLGWWWPPQAGWLHAKVALALGLVGYHLYLNRIRRRVAENPGAYTHKALRWVNELPVPFLILMVLLVEFKPF